MYDYYRYLKYEKKKAKESKSRAQENITCVGIILIENSNSQTHTH